MDIKVYRFINSHAMTQIIFSTKNEKQNYTDIFTGTIISLLWE